MLKGPHPKSTQWNETAEAFPNNMKDDYIEVTIRGLEPVQDHNNLFRIHGVSIQYLNPDDIRETFKLDNNDHADELFVGFLLDQYRKHQISKILADRIVA